MRQTLTLCRDHWDYYRTGPAVPRRLESLTAYRCHCNVGPDFLCRLYFKILWIKKSLLLLLLFVFHYVFCGIACEQQTYFRSSLLSLRKMTSDLIGQHQNKRFYVTEIVLPLGFADANFSEGEKRRPEIRLLFAGYYGRIRIISVVSTDTSVKVSVDTPVAISVECRSTFSIRYMILSFFCSHESYCGWSILNVLQLV